MIAGNSRVQNKAIGAAFFYMHIIEKWGSGIPRIFEDAKLYGLRKPEIKDFGTSFRISIYRQSFETDPMRVANPIYSRKTDAEKSSLASNYEAKHQELSSIDAENENSASAEVIALIATKISEKNQKRALIILGEIRRDEHVTADDIASATDMSRATVQRVISEMKSAGILNRTGSNNGGSCIK